MTRCLFIFVSASMPNSIGNVLVTASDDNAPTLLRVFG